MLGSVTTTMLVVTHVWCSSGAPVNHALTAVPGDHWPMLEEAIDDLRALDWTLRFPMTDDGRSYAGGRPPCPTGDVLNIKLERTPTS